MMPSINNRGQSDTWILIVQSEAYEECCTLVGFKRIDFKIEMSAGAVVRISCPCAALHYCCV